MPLSVVDVISSFRQTFISGAATTIAAGTASAGHIFSMRYVAPGANPLIAMRLKSLEVEFLLATAFGAAQEVGYDVMAARAFTASPTGATTITLVGNDAKKRTSYANSAFVTGGDIRVASAAAMTVGTLTFDSFPIARDSSWMAAIGAKIGPTRHDFSQYEPFGNLFAHNEGFVVRNSILMGATGVGVWKFTPEWEEVLLGN